MLDGSSDGVKAEGKRTWVGGLRRRRGRSEEEDGEDDEEESSSSGDWGKRASRRGLLECKQFYLRAVQKNTAVGFRRAGFEVLRLAQRAQSGWEERSGKVFGGFLHEVVGCM
jgi:hypothetical protein